MANAATKSVLRGLCNRYRLSFLYLAEPWCLNDPDDRLWSTLGLSLVAQNDKVLRSIWVFKTLNIVNFEVVASHPQHVTASFVFGGLSKLFLLFMLAPHILQGVVYGIPCLLFLFLILG